MVLTQRPVPVPGSVQGFCPEGQSVESATTELEPLGIKNAPTTPMRRFSHIRFMQVRVALSAEWLS